MQSGATIITCTYRRKTSDDSLPLITRRMRKRSQTSFSICDITTVCNLYKIRGQIRRSSDVVDTHRNRVIAVIERCREPFGTVVNRGSIRNGEKQKTLVDRSDMREWAVVVEKSVRQIIASRSSLLSLVSRVVLSGSLLCRRAPSNPTHKLAQ
jgi:hypothetical protein